MKTKREGSRQKRLEEGRRKERWEHSILENMRRARESKVKLREASSDLVLVSIVKEQKSEAG